MITNRTPGAVPHGIAATNAAAAAIRIIAIMELKQYVNEVGRYHRKRKKQVMTDSASLPERLRSVRKGADDVIPLGDALQGDDSSALRPEA